jgi:class 3 adenylate cyclase
MSAPPSGTVTFLFTDIEGSTKRWEHTPGQMQPGVARRSDARQEAILRQAIAANGGYAYKMIGDAFQAAFPTAIQALQAAIDAQRTLQAEKWPAETGEIKVRMALHTGTTEEREGDYVGPLLNRVARLLSAGYGGQILLTEATQTLLRDQLHAGVTLHDLGEHRLKDLERPEHVFQIAAQGLRSDFPPLKTLDTHPNNLPIQPTPFIGREKEVDAAIALLNRQDLRLLTLTGPGGTGKTRLALQIAAELIDSLSHGVFFVNLAPISEANLVPATIAQTLGLREGDRQTLMESLKVYLRDRHMLLVLDNFEQVADAAPLVSQLLQASPQLKVLVTSRSVLHLRGEKDFPVPPLALPDPKHLPSLDRLDHYEAISLFVQRAA